MFPEGTRVAVLGMGNVLMGDDALGPWVVRFLEAGWSFPDGVVVHDVGTPGLDLTPYLTDVETVVLVDTVKSSGEPGELRLYRKDEILRHAPQPRLSPHDPGVKEALLTLDFAERGPSEVLLVGVIPERVGDGAGLSGPVRDAVPAAAQAVVTELERLGLPPVRREPAGEPDIWWEAPRP